MFFKRNHDPILVEVRDGQYNCYGDLTTRSAWLAALLKRQGGVNETVEEGYYHYNAIRRGFKLIITLSPYQV